MAIQIIRNADGNCIEFRGSTNPVYWNACLSGEVDTTFTDKINVINDVATAAADGTIYEFYQIDYTEFRDASNQPFAAPADVAAYITAQGNVISQAESTYQGVWDAATNTPTLTDGDSPQNGDFYFVSEPGTTLLGGVNEWKQHDRVIWSGTAWEKIPARQLLSGSTRSVLLNTQTAIYADGEGATSDPTNQVPGWYYKNSDQGKINWYFFGDSQAIDYTLGDFDGFYAVVDLRSATSYLYWTVYTTPQGDGQDQSWYRSRITYSDENAVQAASGKVLLHSAGMDVSAIEPLLPRVSIGTDALTTVGLQANDEELYLMALSTSSGYDAGYNEFVVEKVGYKLGENIQEFQLSAPPTTGASITDETPESLDFRVDPTNTTILVDDGSQYGVNSIHAVGNGDGTVDITALPSNQVLYNDLAFGNLTIQGGAAYLTENGAVNALNALFQVQPLGTGGDYAPNYPVLDLADVTENRNNGNVPTTTLSDGVTPHLMVSSANDTRDVYYSDETIDTAGEYYTVRICGKGRFILGLGSESDGDRAELDGGATASASGLLWGNAFYNYGTYRAPWTYFGSSAAGVTKEGWTGSTDQQLRYNTSVQDELDAPNLKDGALFKVGIDDQGFIAVWYYDEGRSNDWIMTARRSLTTAAGNYFLVVKLWDGTATLASTPQRSAVDPTAPVLDYRYIESPDGSFFYPLFATEEEANYVDTENGGSGTSHAHVFPDDTTNTTWYMPDTGGTHAGASAPTSSTGVTYTEIPTAADSLYAPALLTLPDYTFTENQTVNIQVVPQDVVATVSGLPSGLNYNLGFITGTTSYVSADTDYTITVERSNSYGTTTQTFTISVTDNASLGDFTGFTEHRGNLVQPNRVVLSEDALIQYDTVLSQGQQLTYSYDAIPPSIGILSTIGEAALTDLQADSSIVLGATQPYDYALTDKWDLRYVAFGGFIGNTGKYELTGWTDNSMQSGAAIAGDVFKLEYANDGYIRLYYGGVLKLTSASTFTGDQTITLAAFDDQQQSDVYVPADWTITNIGAGTTTPPTGFVDPLLSGQMGSLTVLGDGTTADAATQLTEQLKVNHRYIFPQNWVEANLLPYVQTDDTDVYIGVPQPGASWSDVGTGDFDAMFKLEGTATASHVSKIKVDPLSGDSFSINSLTDAYYDYALEWDGEDLHVIACNIGDINTQPSIAAGGTFSRVMTYTGYGTASGLSGQPLDIVIGVDNGGQANLTTSGLQQIRTPFGARDILLGEASNGTGEFSTAQPTASLFDENNGGHAPSSFTFAAPTLNAGYTYRFVYHASMESGDFLEFRRADDNTVYTTGVTTFGSGDPTFSGAYKGVEFAVPADAPPLKAYLYNTYQSGSYDAGRDLPISGSTYVVPVTGITQEGPAANQTGTNVMDATDHGWISLDEQLSAGERLVLDNAFFADFLAEANGTNTIFAIGLKGDNWVNTFEVNSAAAANAGEIFKGDTYLVGVCNSNATGIQFRIIAGSTQSNLMGANLNEYGTVCAFFDVTSTGNNIRAGLGRNGSLGVTAGDESTVAYADWNAYKAQSGDQGFGITNADVVMSFWTFNGGDIDGAEIDWTGLSEISIPQPAAAITTPWTKALDFSGSSERAQMVSTDSSHNPLMMGNVGATVAGNATAGYTASGSNSRPWAAACVFSSDNNSSNQHIWNVGEGAGSTDDNIYLRLDSIRNLYFGWGRSGALNECFLGTLASGSGNWYGIYVAHTGERLSGANATAANLADCFDIRGINLSTGSVSPNISTATNWTTNGGRMDRTISGATTVGGRGSNRNFHGKVASFVATTLKLNVPMPSDAEIAMMVRDPQQWLTDYKVGQPYRLPTSSTPSTVFSLNDSGAAATQVWLMGDGTSDAYAQIRNDVRPSTQYLYPLNMISMVSNDIQTVNISGLS